MRVLLILFLTGIAFSPTQAQNIDSLIQKQAQQVAKALIEKDFAYIIDHTYPEIIRLSGGREYLLKGLEREFLQLEKEGLVFKNIQIEMPSKIVNAANELHCIVPQTLELQVKGGKLISKGHLLGISKDQGQHWYFIDTAQINQEQVNAWLPHYNPELVIPAKGIPLFTAETE